MAAILWSDVVALDAELAGVSAAAQALFLAWANEELEVSNFRLGEIDPKLKLARAFLAAHFGRLWFDNADDDGTAGPIKSKTITSDSMTVTYGNDGSSATTEESLASTEWGNAYLFVMRAQPTRAGFTT